jgi:hypothetical protein
MPCIVVGTYAAFLDFINISGYLSAGNSTVLFSFRKFIKGQAGPKALINRFVAYPSFQAETHSKPIGQFIFPWQNKPEELGYDS